MKKILALTLAVMLGCGSLISGCVKKAGSSNEAIDISKTLKTVEEKADYLMGQAKAFYNSKNFQEAVNVAQYVLSYVDKNSQDAKTLVEKAKSELEALARQKADELKNKLLGK